MNQQGLFTLSVDSDFTLIFEIVRDKGLMYGGEVGTTFRMKRYRLAVMNGHCQSNDGFICRLFEVGKTVVIVICLDLHTGIINFVAQVPPADEINTAMEIQAVLFIELLQGFPKRPAKPNGACPEKLSEFPGWFHR